MGKDGDARAGVDDPEEDNGMLVEAGKVDCGTSGNSIEFSQKIVLVLDTHAQ